MTGTSGHPPRRARGYREAGVDIDAGAELVRRIAPLAAATARPGADAALGGFGAVFDLAAAGRWRDPLLVASADGVGTKAMIAAAVGSHRGVGVDLVAMCVNDLVVQGAEPLFFLDYFATGALSVDAAAETVAGVAEGCRRAGCALIGGETAEMPGLYRNGEYDLAGFAVGAVERDRLLPRGGVRPGDAVLGLASDGVHANGFSLIRRLVADRRLSWDAPAPFAPGRALGEALLTPTRIYVASALRALAALPQGVRALAHVTGRRPGGESAPRPATRSRRAHRSRVVAAAPRVRLDRRRGRRAPRRNVARFQLRRRHGGGGGAPRGRRRGRRVRRRRRDRLPHRRGRGRARRNLSRRLPVAVTRIAILISGRGSNMRALVEACRTPGFPAEPALVLSDRPDAAGLAVARGYGLPAAAVDRREHSERESFDAALDAALAAHGADLVCLAGFMRLLGAAFVARWRDRLINIHPSLLPAFKGLDTHARALAAGVRIAGCTVHFVRPEMDEGPIVAQAAVPVAPGDDADSLARRVLAREHRIYPLAVRWIAEGRVRVAGDVVSIDGVAPPEGALLNPAPP